MRKFFKKIICVCAASVMCASLFAVSACGGVYDTEALKGDISGEISSNGGFAVEKGNYIYYINGKQTNTADNTFGEVETGAIMRINKSDLSARNYDKAETVVPQIVHSGNYNGGLFIYGDYVYYSTPSAEKNSDGEIQNSNIQFKRAKLDGTEVMKDYYAQYSDNTIEYRYVECDGTVYLLYVAKSETLYSSSCTNLHSVNTKTGKDTLLAYNVGTVLFDSKDLTNPRVYYTMKTQDYVLDNSFKSYNSSSSKYNQIYTVTADATKANEYDFSAVADYDSDEEPLYVNCGTLVLDGIGKVDANLHLTQFNAKELSDEKVLADFNGSSYTYTLSNYENNTLFFTRTSTNYSTANLFAESETKLLAEDHKPALDNPSSIDEEFLHVDGSNASNYTYIFDADKNVTGAYIASDSGLIRAGLVGGKLKTDVDYENTYYVTKGGKPTILFTQDNYIYYSESGSGANGYIIKRVSVNGSSDDYNKMPEKNDVNEYTPVQILDLDCSSDWYKPEMFDGKIIFSTQTKNMTEYSSGTSNYSHIMVCDITVDGKVMTNEQIDGITKQYKKIEEKIVEVDETVYENLKNAYRYAHYTGDISNIDKLIKAYVEIEDEDEEKFWSKETIKKVEDFLVAEGDWKEFDKKVTVNGEDVYANQRDYYYALLGEMTNADKDAYDTYLVETYLQSWPEEELGWFESLSTGAKAGLIIGIIFGSLFVITAVAVVTIVIIRVRKSKLPVYTKKRIKVDTTDDKSVDVYATDDADGNLDGSAE